MPEFTLIPGGMPPVQRYSSSPPVTERQIHGTTLRQICALHYPDGHGQIFRAVDHSRLAWISRTWTAEERTETYWMVDGTIVADIDEAIELLNTPPKLDEAERAVLAELPAEWTPASDFQARLLAGYSREARLARLRVLRSVAYKGFLEIEPNRLRRIANTAP